MTPTPDAADRDAPGWEVPADDARDEEVDVLHLAGQRPPEEGAWLWVTTAVRHSGNGARSNWTAGWPMRVAAARLRAPRQAAGPEARAGAMAGRACCGQHAGNTSPGIGEDQHAGNTNKTSGVALAVSAVLFGVVRMIGSAK